MNETNNIIAVHNLVKNFSQGGETLYILRGVHLEIAAGHTVSITGQSGSGKTALLNILGGLDDFNDGSVLVGGQELKGLSETALSVFRRKKAGFIFQFHYLLKDFTALENVMLPAYIGGMRKKTALEKARSLLSDMRLDSRISHYPAQLSGGERQRVAVARSMINDPDVILADEPTGNLDPENSAAVSELLYSNAEKWHKSLLVVTHDKNVAHRAMSCYQLTEGVLKPEPLPAIAVENAQEGGGNKLPSLPLAPAASRLPLPPLRGTAPATPPPSEVAANSPAANNATPAPLRGNATPRSGAEANSPADTSTTPAPLRGNATPRSGAEPNSPADNSDTSTPFQGSTTPRPTAEPNSPAANSDTPTPLRVTATSQPDGTPS
jgi:lipoprotein-releasing system ATP-binding protein